MNCLIIAPSSGLCEATLDKRFSIAASSKSSPSWDEKLCSASSYFFRASTTSGSDMLFITSIKSPCVLSWWSRCFIIEFKISSAPALCNATIRFTSALVITLSPLLLFNTLTYSCRAWLTSESWNSSIFCNISCKKAPFFIISSLAASVFSLSSALVTAALAISTFVNACSIALSASFLATSILFTASTALFTASTAFTDFLTIICSELDFVSSAKNESKVVI